MTSKTSFILKTMNIVFWIIFIGLCIQTGAILISFAVSLFVNSEGAGDLYNGLNLSELLAFDMGHYISVVSLLISITALKAYLAYLVVKIFLKFDFSQPFSRKVSLLISQISHVALAAGVLAMLAGSYTRWLMKKGVTIPLSWESNEFLFLAGIIFIIAQVFKKGIEIQSENELTV